MDVYIHLCFCLPSTATNQVYVTAVAPQQPFPAMHYQTYYPAYAPVQSVHVGQPNLAPPPLYLEASEFYLYIHCSLSKQKTLCPTFIPFPTAHQFFFLSRQPVWTHPPMSRPACVSLPVLRAPSTTSTSWSRAASLQPCVHPESFNRPPHLIADVRTLLTHPFWSSPHLCTPSA